VSRIRVLVALLVTGLLAVPVAGAAAKSKHSGTVKVSRGATTLALDPDTAAALTGLGLTVTPLSPSRVADAGVAFPITTGRLNAKSYAGEIRHTGGLRIASSATHVDLNNFRIVIDDAPNLTAQVGSGDRVSIADLDLSGATITPKGKTLTITGVAVALSDDAAAALNAAFGTDALKGGTPLGTASVSTKLKKVKK
jgi:Htaa